MPKFPDGSVYTDEEMKRWEEVYSPKGVTMTYEEFEKKCIASGETDETYLRSWWDKYQERKFLVRYF